MHGKFALVLGAAVLLVNSAAPAADDANQKDIAAWQGTWQAVSFEADGKPTPAEQLQRITLKVEGTNYHFQNGNANFSEHGSYAFHADQSPKALDIVVGDGQDKGKTYNVIYKVDGERLTICLRIDNKGRPPEFTGKAGSGCVLEVWQRSKS